MFMDITYDPNKNQRNIEERGLSFDLVAGFDFETAVIWIDERKNYPEVRYSALGLIEDRVYSVIFSEAAQGIRVISFRKANQREVKRYEQETQP